MPESLRDSRVDPGRRGALLLTLVAAVAAILAAVGVWRDRPEPRPVQSVSLAQVTDASVAGPASKGPVGGVSGSASASKAADGARSARSSGDPTATVNAAPMVVSVTGAVRKPGLVRLPAGSRVADAIARAGGVTSQANLTGLNLAQKLTDGSSVVVSDVAGSSGGSGSSVSDAGTDPAGSVPSSGAGGGKLDLNTADVAALDALPGVGPVTAASIVAWREKNGRFTSVEQLQEISGIGPAKFAALAQLVTV